MPRVIDFTSGNETDWNEVRLPSPVYGGREIRAEELDAIVQAFDGPVVGFEPQFSTYGMSVSREASGEIFDRAHAWLSENATGPWSWMEHWTNHGHHIDVAVFVEREPDRIAFFKAHGNVFSYRPPEHHALERLAVVRGVLPKPTAQESFGVWCHEHAGFRYLPAEDLGPDHMRVVFDHPGLEADFLKRWGDRFSAEERDGERVHAGAAGGRSWRDSPSVWLSANAAVGSPAGGNTPEGYQWSIVTRYDDVAEALRRDWGHVFQGDESGRTFRTPDYPLPPARELPADFAAYLGGDAETYEAPHLPSGLAAFRTADVASPASPRA
jgi:hypothetical protein